MSDILNRLVVKPQLAKCRKIMHIPRAIERPKVNNLATRATQTKKPAAQPPVSPQASQPASKSASKPASKPVGEQSRQQNSGLSLQAVARRQRAISRGRPNANVPKKIRYITPDVNHSDQIRARNVRGLGAGKILLIIGNGPSINEVPLNMLSGNPSIDVMSINRPDDRLWPTTYWTFFDQSQLRRHRQLWEQYRGIIFNSTSIKEQTPNSVRLKNLGGFGFSMDLMRGLHIGRSSVYAAMQIALWLDYKYVYIFGCDMRDVDGKTHFYGVNPDAPPEARLGRFAKEAEYYDDAARLLDDEQRSRFIFCSSYNTYPFVEKFSRVDQREAVPIILERARTLFQ